MISYAQALQQLLAQVAPLGAEACPPGQASGRVLASAVHSPIALPSFDHAAMDGYALSASAVVTAGSEHLVHGSQAAGSTPSRSTGGAWEIMTGACLPQGLDAVIAVERTELLESKPSGMPARIRLRDALAAGHNVRLAGSDIEQGAEVLVAGASMSGAQAMLLAALGVSSIPVVQRPRVAIICTGKELQTNPGQLLAPGRIHNSNGPYLVAELTAAGAQVMCCETVDDSADTYMDALRRALETGADLVLSTGAVSMGRYDFVPDALRRLNAQILFHHVAIRPGRPLLAASLAGGPLLLALPGTPMAVAVGLRFFVMPLLRAMTGQPPEPVLHAVLMTPQQPKHGLRHFLHARLGQDHECRLRATVSNLQQPFRIQPFAQADAWVVLPEDAGVCAAGMQVEIVSHQPGIPPRIDAMNRASAASGSERT